MCWESRVCSFFQIFSNIFSWLFGQYPAIFSDLLLIFDHSRFTFLGFWPMNLCLEWFLSFTEWSEPICERWLLPLVNQLSPVRPLLHPSLVSGLGLWHRRGPIEHNSLWTSAGSRSVANKLVRLQLSSALWSGVGSLAVCWYKCVVSGTRAFKLSCAWLLGSARRLLNEKSFEICYC